MAKTIVAGDTAIGICTADIGIPPYQRAGGKWKENKSHKKILFLSSVLNEFPIGAVVIHAEKDTAEQYLMDGQQRRETFDEMLRIRPLLDILCEKFTQDPADFREKYVEFLTTHFYEADGLGPFDPLTPGVKVIIQLREVYGKRTTSGGHKIYPFEKKFLNSKRIVGNPYVSTDGSFKGEDLITGLIRCHTDGAMKLLPVENEEEKKTYAAAVLDKLGITGFIPFGGNQPEPVRVQKSKDAVINTLSNSSVEIKEVASLLHQFHQKVSGCSIGKIIFTADENADGTEYELPTIFRLINDGGEDMHPTELLASAPRWIGSNAQFTLDASCEPFISSIIASLKKDPSAVTSKWFVCASFAKAIDELNKGGGDKYKQAGLLFEPNKKFGPKEYETGFRMKSLFHSHSVTDKDWLSLYTIGKTDDVWTKNSELSELSTIFQLIGEDRYFFQMRRWGWSIAHKIIDGRSRTSRDTYGMLAALRILFLRHPGVTAGSGWTQKKKFILPARKFFDYFVYRNIGSMMFPAGGADSEMKNMLDEMKNNPIFTPNVTKANWENLIDRLVDEGKDITNKDYTHSEKPPKDENANWANWTRLLLAHIYTITHNFCPDETVKYHVDHIIPKDLWQDYCNADPANINQCHNFANLMFLDAAANEKKSNKKLSEVYADPHTRNFIHKFGGIEETSDKFDEYSKTITNDSHSKLATERKALLKDKFIDERAKFLMKEEWWT
jgi:hypothetical protein